MKWSILIAGFLIILLLVGFLIVRPSLWLRGSSAAVSTDGATSPDVDVYLSPNGEILLRRRTPNGYEDYIIREEKQEVGIPDSSNFVSLLFSVYSKEVSPPIVASTNRVKIERDMSVHFQRDWVEFTTSDAKRLKINLRKLND